MSDATKDHARVSIEGKRLGATASKLADKGAAAIISEGEEDERCRSCAFTAGTVPNGCLQTQMDALKALVERVPFMCHQADRKGSVCAGYYQAQVAIRRTGKVFPVTSCPWEFSPADEQPTPEQRP